MAGVLNDDGARQLKELLAEQGQHRWSVCAEALSSAADLGVAFGMIGKFDINVQKLDPAVQFNLLLDPLRSADTDQEDEEPLESDTPSNRCRARERGRLVP